jgi:hypothetical protein
MMIDDHGAIHGMRIGGKPKYSQKTDPSAIFFFQKIPHALAWDETQVAAVGCRRLTA